MSSVLFDEPGPRTRRIILIMNVVGALVLLGLLAWVIIALADKGQFTEAKWSPFLGYSVWLDYLLPGLWATLKAAFIAVITANVFGLIFGVGRLSSRKIVRFLAGVIVEFFRAVPVLVLMIFFYFLFSKSGWMKPDDAPFWAVVLALTLYNGSVMAELVRSGVLNLPRGQGEAALSLGMSEGKTLAHVLLPQALISMMPAMVSQLVVILKDTALGYLITYSELLRQSRLVGTSFSNLVPALIVAAILFIIINFTLTVIAGRLAQRLSSRSSLTLSTLDETDEGVAPGIDMVHTGPVDPAEHNQARRYGAG